VTATSENAVCNSGPVVTVIGEALIDMVPGERPGDFRALPGGSPFNVAVGLARLGRRTSLMARLADNAFGRLLRAHAEAEGIDLSHAPRATEPTSLAIVSLDEHAQAHYDFYLDGTSDWQWSATETTHLPPGTAVLHHGSLASWTAPGDEHIHTLASQLYAGGQVLVSYDPNIRPFLLGDPDKARPSVERSVSRTHLVKASREDVVWLYPDIPLAEIGQHWLTLGAFLVVITDGPNGAHLFRPGEPPLTRPGRKVAVADTVGAGDSFTAAFLDALVRHSLHTPQLLQQATLAALLPAADDAILVSALTCERSGANPPRVFPRPGGFTTTSLTPRDLQFG
jgi:fructokinase